MAKKRRKDVGGLIPGEGIRYYDHDMEYQDEWCWESDLRPYESRKKPKAKKREQGGKR